MTDIGKTTAVPTIDGVQYLRAIAALMVVAHHARHYFGDVPGWTNFGSRGVDIFFVVSGFIMVHSTQGYRADAPRWPQAAEFLLKRAIRVVPLYWLALLWTSKRVLFAGSSSADILRDLFFVPHFHRDYTDSIFPYLVPGWTINYEMFFYALFAISLLLGSFRFLFMALALTGLAALGAGAWRSAPALFYTSSVLLEFLFGIAVYFAAMRWQPTVSRPALMLLTVIAFALLAIENSDAVRGYADGPFAALVVWLVVKWSQGIKLGWLRQLGDASYAIYLFHLSSFWIAGTLLRKAGIEAASTPNIVIVVGLHLAVATAAGLLIHRFVETPLLNWLRRRLTPGA